MGPTLGSSSVWPGYRPVHLLIGFEVPNAEHELPALAHVRTLRQVRLTVKAARVRGLAAGNRRHWLGSPAFRHRSMIHSHLSARSMRPSPLLSSRTESGAIRPGGSARPMSH